MSNRAASGTMAEWVETYLDVGIQSTSANTRKAPRSTLEAFAEWYDKTRKHPRNVGQEDLVRFFFREAPFVGKINERSHNHYRRYLRAFLTWAMKTRRIKHENPMELLEAIDRQTVVERDFTKIDTASLASMIADCPDPRDQALLATFIYSCARASDVNYPLRVRDIDLDAGVIHWRNVKKKRPIDKPILRQLDPPLRAWFELYLGGGVTVVNPPPDQRDWIVFPRRDGQLRRGQTVVYQPRVRISNLARTVQRYTQPVMGKSFYEGGAHTLRRSGALAIISSLTADGVAPETARSIAQYMLDHKDPMMTDHYTGNSIQKAVTWSTLQGRNILPDLTNVVPLRSTGG